MAGRGGLNLTHSEPLEIFLTRYGAAAERLEPIIRAFPPDRLREFCAELGEETFIGSSGRVFPKSFKASPLLRALLARLTAQGVRFERGAFEGFVGDGALSLRGPGDESRALAPGAAVLALGGASWPRLGSDGGWTRAFDALGVAMTPLGAGQLRRADPLERAFSGRLRGPADQNHPAASRRRHGARRSCRHPRGARGRAGLCVGFQPARGSRARRRRELERRSASRRQRRRTGAKIGARKGQAIAGDLFAQDHKTRQNRNGLAARGQSPRLAARKRGARGAYQEYSARRHGRRRVSSGRFPPRAASASTNSTPR